MTAFAPKTRLFLRVRLHILALGLLSVALALGVPDAAPASAAPCLRPVMLSAQGEADFLSCLEESLDAAPTASLLASPIPGGAPLAFPWCQGSCHYQRAFREAAATSYKKQPRPVQLPAAADFQPSTSPLLAKSTRHVAPAPIPEASAPGRTALVTRTAFGAFNAGLPDIAYGIAAPTGNHLFVSRKVLLKNHPAFPGQNFNLLVLEVYTKAGVWQNAMVLPLPSVGDWIGQADAYTVSADQTAVYVVGSWSLAPLVLKFNYVPSQNALTFATANTVPFEGDWALLWSIQVSAADGSPRVYVAGSDYDITGANNTDGLLAKFDLNLNPLGHARLWTIAQGYPCHDELEASSLYVDAFGIFTVADADKVSNHVFGRCDGQPQRGAIAHTSFDLKTTTIRKFDDGAGTITRTSDSVTGNGTGLYITSGYTDFDNFHVSIVGWNGTAFSPFTHWDMDRFAPYTGSVGMNFGGISLRETAPGKWSLVISGFVEDGTANCQGLPCADWALWIFDATGATPPTAEHPAFDQTRVSPTYDMSWALTPDADDPSVYYQVGCSHGTRRSNGFGTDCFMVTLQSPDFHSRLHRIQITTP